MQYFEYHVQQHYSYNNLKENALIIFGSLFIIMSYLFVAIDICRELMVKPHNQNNIGDLMLSIIGVISFILPMYKHFKLFEIISVECHKLLSFPKFSHQEYANIITSIYLLYSFHNIREFKIPNYIQGVVESLISLFYAKSAIDLWFEERERLI